MLSPLLVLPLIAHYLDQDDFAYYLYLVSLGTWMSIVVEFGFIISATREIAKNHCDKIDLQIKLYSVVSAKILLSVILLIISLALSLYLSSMIYLLSWGYATILGFNYTWFFQGLRKLTVPLVSEFISMLFLIVGVYLVIYFGGDIQWIVAILMISKFLGLSTYIILIRQFWGLRVWCFKWSFAVVEIRKTFSAFLLISFVGFYTSFNVVYLGWLAVGVQLIYFAGAEKLVRAACSLISPISQALFPEMAQRFDKDINAGLKLFKWMLVLITMIGFFFYLIILFFSNLLINVFLGYQYADAQAILIILGAMLPAVALSSVLSMHFLVPFGKEKFCTRVYFIAGMVNLVLVLSCVKLFGSIAMAYSVVISEYVVTVLMAFLVFKLMRVTQKGKV